MREIGDQLTPWDELQKIKAHCKARGAHLHIGVPEPRLREALAIFADTLK